MEWFIFSMNEIYRNNLFVDTIKFFHEKIREIFTCMVFFEIYMKILTPSLLKHSKIQYKCSIHFFYVKEMQLKFLNFFFSSFFYTTLFSHGSSFWMKWNNKRPWCYLPWESFREEQEVRERGRYLLEGSEHRKICEEMTIKQQTTWVYIKKGYIHSLL